MTKQNRRRSRMMSLFILLGLLAGIGGCMNYETSQLADLLSRYTLAYPRGFFSTGSW